MALRGSLAEPLGRGFDVHGNTATQLVGLTQIELRVRIASRSGWPPLLDRGVIFALFPCIDARLDISHDRSEEHTSELQSLMRISYAVFCLKKKKTIIQH